MVCRIDCRGPRIRHGTACLPLLQLEPGWGSAPRV